MKVAVEIVFLILCVICAFVFLGSRDNTRDKSNSMQFLFGSVVFGTLIFITEIIWR